MNAVVVNFPKAKHPNADLARFLATIAAITARAEHNNATPLMLRAALALAFLSLDRNKSPGYAVMAGNRVLRRDDNLDPDNPDVTSDDDTFAPPVSPLSTQVLTF